MDRLTTLIPTFAILLVGCLGLVSSDQPPGGGSPSAASEESHRNLTVEVLDWDAQWEQREGAEGTVRVRVEIKASLSRAGDPVAGRLVEGFVNVTASTSWECGAECSRPAAVNRRAFYSLTTEEDGSVSFPVDVEFDGSEVPPIGESYCREAHIWTWGIAGWTNASAPLDAHSVWTELCTQSYP